MKLYHDYFSCVSAKSWCLSKIDSENYVAITQGAGRSRALVEGGGRRASTLVEKMVCYGNLLWRLMGRTREWVMGFSSHGWDSSIWSVGFFLVSLFYGFLRKNKLYIFMHVVVKKGSTFMHVTFKMIIKIY
jgi:hypothetical protein